VFEAIEPDSKNDILFSEYVHMVSFFVMLGHKELSKFLFHCADDEKLHYLRSVCEVRLCVCALWCSVNHVSVCA
jgi:hypothetical protein